MTWSDDTVTQGQELVTWGRTVCERKNTISDVSSSFSPMCGSVWTIPGSQGIKSSPQSHNLDLFPMCHFTNYKTLCCMKNAIYTMTMQIVNWLNKSWRFGVIFFDTNWDLTRFPLGLRQWGSSLAISDDYAKLVNKLALRMVSQQTIVRLGRTNSNTY